MPANPKPSERFRHTWKSYVGPLPSFFCATESLQACYSTLGQKHGTQTRWQYLSLFLRFSSTKGLKSQQWKVLCYPQWLIVTFIIVVTGLPSNYKAQLFSHVSGLLTPSSHFPHPNIRRTTGNPLCASDTASITSVATRTASPPPPAQCSQQAVQPRPGPLGLAWSAWY